MPRMALVVDDSMLIRHAVCRYFEERGFVVESATNGLEALEVLLHLTPNIIVTDLEMPKMSGQDLITVLKNRPETADLPIIVLAGKRSISNSPDENRANAVVYKDIDIDEQLDRAVSTIYPEPARS